MERPFRYEGGGMAAQDALQVLVEDEASPDQPREPQHHGEQPDDAGEAGLVGEGDLEAGQVDLRLLARQGLEAHLERPRGIRPQSAHRAFHRRVAAGVAALAEFTPKPDGGQPGIGGQPLAQVTQEGIGAARPRLAGPVGGRLQAAGDVFAHRLAVDAELPGDGGGAQPLPMKLQDHDEVPKSQHRSAPSSRGGSLGDHAPGACRDQPRQTPVRNEVGKIRRPFPRSIQRPPTTAAGSFSAAC